jgi:hypothetical protein
MKGCIHPRGENTFLLVFDLPRGADGKRKQKYVTFHGGKRQAQTELN